MGGEEEETFNDFDVHGVCYLLEASTRKIFVKKDGKPVGDHVAMLGETDHVEWVWLKKKIGEKFFSVNAAGHVKNTITNGGEFVGILGEDGNIIPGAKPE